MSLQDHSRSVDEQELQRWMGEVKVQARQATSLEYTREEQVSELVNRGLRK